MPGAPVVAAVPDIKTMKKDLKTAGIELTDSAGLRLDFHALRHTFQTSLDRTGCSRATKKKLMRHANEDVTDGYAHAELAEMLTALVRLPSPQSSSQASLKTGTDDAALSITNAREGADHQLDHGSTAERQSAALIGAIESPDVAACQNWRDDYNLPAGNDLHRLALIGTENSSQVIVNTVLRPSTQVD